LHTDGLPSLNHFSINHKDEGILTTLFTQIMLEKGYLAYNQFKPSYAHRVHHVERYLDAVREAFDVLAKAIEQGNPSTCLKGPAARRGFYRLT
jgi:hypothetical protein